MKEIEVLVRYQKKYNFLNEKFLNEIERVDIFFENCAECSSTEECGKVETIGLQGHLLKKLYYLFKDAGVDSHLHEFTSENNGEIEEVASRHDCVLPLKALFYPQGPVACPMHNFMHIVKKDGHKLLYQVGNAPDGDESSHETMMYA